MSFGLCPDVDTWYIGTGRCTGKWQKNIICHSSRKNFFPRPYLDHRNKLSNSRQFRIESIMWKKICRTLKGNNLILDTTLQKEVDQQALVPVRSSVRNNTLAYKNYLEILLLGPIV